MVMYAEYRWDSFAIAAFGSLFIAFLLIMVRYKFGFTYLKIKKSKDNINMIMSFN